MHLRLADICDIKFGVHERPNDEGAIKYLQARHFNELGNLNGEIDSFLNDYNTDQLLQDGDVLLAGKGSRNFAWCYREPAGEAIASSLFFIIRADLSLIYPEYLAALFNLTKSQVHFHQLSAGSSIQSIRKNELQDFEVPLLPIADQQKVVEITDLYKKEIGLTQQLLEKNKELYNAVITKMIN